jgi:hypothetical protein
MQLINNTDHSGKMADMRWSGGKPVYQRPVMQRGTDLSVVLQLTLWVMLQTQKLYFVLFVRVIDTTSPFHQMMCEGMKEISLLPGFAYSKTSGNSERCTNNTTTSHYLLLSCMPICH